MDKDPVVTVVVPVYNGAKWINRTLASAINQTYQNIEIIVVNDGSIDNTRALVEAIALNDSRVRLLNKPNTGLPSTRNFGVSHSRGEFIAPLDADDLWHPKKIAKQIEKARMCSTTVGLIYCWAVEIDENDYIIPPIRGGAIAEGNVFDELVGKAGIIDSASNPLIKRAYFDAVGGYDPKQTLGAEDWKLYLSLAEISEFGVVPLHLVGYRRNVRSMSRNIAKMAQGLEMVANWIRERRPELPPKLFEQMEFHINGYLAHLALTIDDLDSAVQHQVKRCRAKPSSIMSVSNAVFLLRLLARKAGISRSQWVIRRELGLFSELKVD